MLNSSVLKGSQLSSWCIPPYMWFVFANEEIYFTSSPIFQNSLFFWDPYACIQYLRVSSLCHQQSPHGALNSTKEGGLAPQRPFPMLVCPFHGSRLYRSHIDLLYLWTLRFGKKQKRRKKISTCASFDAPLNVVWSLNQQRCEKI